MKVDTNFEIDRNGKSIFSNIFSTMEVGRGSHKNIDKQLLYIIQEIKPENLIGYYPAYMKKDIDVLKNFNNSNEFWTNNAPVKQTKEISDLILKIQKFNDK